MNATHLSDDAGSREMPLVSLIVVTYNSASLLPPFFAALAATTYTAYEVVVVDNASDDDTLGYLAEAQPWVRALASRENQGFGRACNQGARMARGDFLMFLNPDVIVTPAWLEILVRHITARRDTAIICPTTLYPGQQPVVSAQAVEEVGAVPGCAMLIPRPAWDVLGGFDEQFFMYWEDTELCWRAWLRGWRVLADLQAQVYHQRGGSTGGQRWDVDRVKNSLYTYLKLMRWRRAIPFTVGLAAKTMIKLALRRQPELLGAWWWNFTNLGMTLARRRELRRVQHGSATELERRVAAQARRLRRERWERRQMLRRLPHA